MPLITAAVTTVTAATTAIFAGVRVVAQFCLAMILLLPSWSWAAATFVQSTSGYCEGTSCNATFGRNVTAGNAILVCVFQGNTVSTITRVADAIPNPYTLLHNPTDSGAFRGAMAYSNDVAGGWTQLTTTMSGSEHQYIVAHEITGQDPTTLVDDSSMAAGSPGTGTNGMDTGRITTTADDQYVFACGGNGFGGASTNITAGSDGTLQVNTLLNGSIRVVTEHDTKNTGTFSSAFTTDQNLQYIAGVIAVKSAAGGGSGPASPGRGTNSRKMPKR